MEQNKEKKSKTRAERGRSKAKFILLGLGVVALTGTAIYFYMSKKPKTNLTDSLLPFDNQQASLPLLPDSTQSNRKVKASGGFPLKKGSRGDLVEQLQMALVEKYGTDTLPKWGVDGQWGSELTNALIANGHPTEISSELFTKLIKKGGVATSTKKKGFKPKLIATNLRLAVLDDDYSKALRVVGRIKTVNGYKAVSAEFKKKRINGVRKSIVNALLTKFWDKKEKKALNAHFSRIGLLYDGSQWNLSGFSNEEQLKTIRATIIWNHSGQKLPIPKETIIGDFVDAQNGVTTVRTVDNKTLYVSTEDIGYAN